MILGFDIATKLCGWCAGDGASTPQAGAFRLHNREVLAELGCEFKTLVLTLQRRFQATHWFVEAPLLIPTDSLWTLERIYGLIFLLHTLAGSLNIPIEAVPQDTVKLEWSGRQRHPSGTPADQRRRDNKAAMVRICERVGIELPEKAENGRDDAADACGVWKVGLRLTKSPHLQNWDQAIYSHRAGGAPMNVHVAAPGLALLSLGKASCRWPLGDPKHPDFHFCGRQRAGDHTWYCEDHLARSLGAPATNKDRTTAAATYRAFAGV